MCKVLVLHAKYASNSPYLNSMVLGLDEEGFDVKVCYLKGVSDGKNALDTMGKSIYLEGDKALGDSRIKTIWALVKMLRQERPTILHCHRRKPTVYGTLAARLAGVPFIVSHDHGTGVKRLRNMKRRAVNRFIYRWVNRIITCSERGREYILGANSWLEPSRVTTVWNGVDTSKVDSNPSKRDAARETFGVLSSDEVVFGTVGRLATKKAHACLLDAFTETLKTLPNARLVVAGSGPLLEELQNKAEDLGISSRVNFLGYRKDVFDLLNGFDIFVFPSLSEGLPLSLLEAMASRLPVVISDGSGMPEIFGSGGIGRMVSAGDSSELSEAMVEVGSLSSDERVAMGERARKRVLAEFTAKHMREGIVEVYKEIKGL